MNQKIEHYFKTYKESEECFETSDGMLFHARGNAESHAGTLQDKKVVKHEGAEYRAKGTEQATLVVGEPQENDLASAGSDTEGESVTEDEPTKVVEMPVKKEASKKVSEPKSEE